MKPIFYFLILLMLALMAISYTAWRADTRAYPETDSMYFEIVFENDTVIHMPYE